MPPTGLPDAFLSCSDPADELVVGVEVEIEVLLVAEPTAEQDVDGSCVHSAVGICSRSDEHIGQPVTVDVTAAREGIAGGV
jgi:hypothetical protein